jgi:hypothetical protein
MRQISDLLREFDPLKDDNDTLNATRDEMRRTVVAAASARERAEPGIGRRTVLRAAGALVALALVAAVLTAPAEWGALQAAVRFEVRLAEAQPAPGLIVARATDPARLLYLHPEAIVTNDDVARSFLLPDGPDRFSISVEFFDPGAARMRQATANHIGRPVAILIDGEVVMAPFVRSPIAGAAVITGNFTQAEAERVAEGIAIR